MEIKTSNRVAKPGVRGRPREFDVGDALDKAISVFCERGFHGASIEDLSATMTLTVGSIYKAFKDKRGIFLAALDRHNAMRDSQLRDAVAPARSGRDRLRAALLFYVDLSHGSVGKSGCLMIASAMELASSEPEVAARASDLLRRRETYVNTFLEQGQRDGSISPSVDRKGASHMIVCILQGMRVVGETGSSRRDLLGAVEAVMKSLH